MDKKDRYFVRFTYSFSKKGIPCITVTSETFKIVNINPGFNEKQMISKLEELTKLDMLDE